MTENNMANDPQTGNVNNSVGNILGEVVTAAGAAIGRAIGNFPAGGVPTARSGVQASFNPSTADGADWRVRIGVPSPYRGSAVLAPLVNTQNSMVFPFTPTIILQHTANYDQLHPVHTNYPYTVYENSLVNDIVITGDFYVENEDDAKYWIACTHFLRTITKMFYGDTSNAGAPPAVCRLNGYGDYVFKDVPVVVQTFTTELPQDVDYIKAAIPGANGDNWVPTHSVISVTLRPTYSRDTVRQFKLDDFVNGSYILGSDGFI